MRKIIKKVKNITRLKLLLLAVYYLGYYVKKEY